MTEPARLAVADRLLDRLVTGGDFDDVPMSDDLSFRGPLATARSAAEYRSICRQFADAVNGIEVRTRMCHGDTVHLVYDVDMGLPDGPLTTSQTIGFRGDAMTDVEVIFDAARVTGMAS